MKLAALAVSTALLFTTACAGNQKICREQNTYLQEIVFIEMATLQSVEKNLYFLNTACSCSGSDWSGPNADECRETAKAVAVINARLKYHPDLMRYNAGIEGIERPTVKPKVAEHYTLCPPEVAATEMD